MANQLIPARQISKYQAATLGLSGVSIAANASSINITSTLTSALSTGSSNGSALPLQVAFSNTNDPQGVDVTNNLVGVWLSSSKISILDANGVAIYGRITQTSNVYTVSFYEVINSVETAYYFNSATTIDITLYYVYSLDNLPYNAMVAVQEKYVGTSQNGGGTSYKEVLTVTSLNTLSAVSKAPNSARPIDLFVNGIEYDAIGSSPAYTVSGSTVTWSAANSGFNLMTTDRVVVKYSV